VPSIAAYGVVLAVVTLTTGVGIPIVRRLAVRLGAVVRPDDRRVHARPTPTLGGLAMLVGFLVGMAVAWRMHAFTSIFDGNTEPLGLVIAAVIILVVGTIDDLREVSAPAKVSGIVVAASVLVFSGISMLLLRIPFGGTFILDPNWSYLISVLWVLGMTNAINLIDGLDGLASGVVAIACAALWFTARLHADFYVMFFASLLIGACAGFLRWNFPPASVFMGDTGSQFLGLTLAAVSLLENRKGTAVLTLLLPLVALGVPLADSALAFVRRLVKRQHVFRGDTSHVHHQLLAVGLSTRAALFSMWALCAFFGLIAVLLEWLPRNWSALLVTVLGAVLFVVLELLRTLRRVRTADDAAASRRDSRRR